MCGIFYCNFIALWDEPLNGSEMKLMCNVLSYQISHWRGENLADPGESVQDS